MAQRNGNVLGVIGHTPLVRLHAIRDKAHLECEVLVKCEFFNPGGSAYDRVALRMVEDAERAGRIHPGDILIVPSTGNAGIGVAVVAAIKGYRCIATLPESMSAEKVNILKALGADLIRTPAGTASSSPMSYIGIAHRLGNGLPNAYVLDPYQDPSNPIAHYEGTAAEILDQCDGRVDMVVVPVGSGGMITGIARKLKEACPNVTIVGVDPEGSVLASGDLHQEHKTSQIEGIGNDFLPTVLQRSLVDKWEVTSDRDSFVMARRLIREEGLLCGGSSGAAVVGALRAAMSLKSNQRCVVLLPDATRNYMSQFINDHWMYRNNFVSTPLHDSDNYVHYRKNLSTWWADQPLSVLPLTPPSTVSLQTPCSTALELMEKHGFDQLPVVEDAVPKGVVTIGELFAALAASRVGPSDPVQALVFTQFSRVTPETTLAELAAIFDKDHFAIVTSHMDAQQGTIQGIATRIDLLNYVTSSSPSPA